MRIAIASDDGAAVAAHTGRCRGFVIYEVSGHTAVHVEHRVNTFTAHARGECSGSPEAGDQHHSHGPLIDALNDCGVLITRGLGPRLIADLGERGIESYVCNTELVEDAARQFVQGRLARAAGVGRCCHE
jgi:predicted Fe-Mo cluster-binding NifX family protein